MFNSLVQSVQAVSDWRFQSDRGEDGYNGFLDVRPSSHYLWYRSGFWFDHVNVKAGSYSCQVLKKAWEVIDSVRIEFNPNKCMDDLRFNALMSTLLSLTKCGSLLECDYTVDVDEPLERFLCTSRKTLITVDKNRYYGKRHSAGRIKIYNKAKELREIQKKSCDRVLSRCEVTCRSAEAVPFDELYLLRSVCSGSLDSLSTNLRSIFALISLLQLHGEDGETLLKQFVPDKRNRDKLIPFIIGDARTAVFDKSIFIELLDQYAAEFRFNYCFSDGNSLFEKRVWEFDEVK